MLSKQAKPLIAASIAVALLGAIVFTSPARPAAAQSPKPNGADLSSPGASYLQGLALLSKGRRLADAVKLLTVASQAEPDNARYKVTLGCAYAAQCYELSLVSLQAKYYAQSLKDHEVFLNRWKVAQRDPASLLYNTPAPPALSAPKLRGEAYPFTLSPEETKSRILATSEATQQLLSEGAILAKRGEPTERAELTSLAGWGLLLLWREPRRTVPASWPTQPGKNPTPDVALALLRDAADAQPGDLEYTRSLGDAYLIAARDKRGYGGLPARFDAVLQNQGIACLQKVALAPKQPKNIEAELWFYLGCAQSDCADKEWDSVIRSLHRAINSDGANGYPKYVLACIFAASGDDKQMTQTLVSAGNSATYTPVFYHKATPRALAWAFPAELTETHSQELALAYGLIRERSRALKSLDKNTLVSLMKFFLAISKKCLNNSQLPDLTPEEKSFYSDTFGLWSSDACDYGSEIVKYFPKDEQLPPLLKEAEELRDIGQKQYAMWQVLHLR